MTNLALSEYSKTENMLSMCSNIYILEYINTASFKYYNKPEDGIYARL